MTHEQAYSKALGYCDHASVESAFCMADSWQEAYRILGIYVDEEE